MGPKNPAVGALKIKKNMVAAELIDEETKTDLLGERNEGD
jgi:hypothetical protein